MVSRADIRFLENLDDIWLPRQLPRQHARAIRGVLQPGAEQDPCGVRLLPSARCVQGCGGDKMSRQELRLPGGFGLSPLQMQTSDSQRRKPSQRREHIEGERRLFPSCNTQPSSPVMAQQGSAAAAVHVYSSNGMTKPAQAGDASSSTPSHTGRKAISLAYPSYYPRLPLADY